jgi:hypothetical protein
MTPTEITEQLEDIVSDQEFAAWAAELTDSWSSKTLSHQSGARPNWSRFHHSLPIDM